MKNENMLRGGLVITMLLCIYLSVMLGNYGNKNIELTNRVDSLTVINDSLHDENFTLNTTLGRVEITLEHLREVDSSSLVKFCEFYDHETE
jgi:hypothetical protein